MEQQEGIAVEKIIDARGRSCPEPVLMIKKAMETKEASYCMTVDNRAAAENVTRYARRNGYAMEVERDGDTYILKMTRG